MPIRIPDSLPATSILESENIFVMTEYRAMHQDIRPLRVLLLNLMPLKIATETQILRKLSNTPIQIEVGLIHMSSHEARNTPAEHLKSFYQIFDEVKNYRYDGLIITGAPIERLEFEDVDYWEEFCEILEWAKSNVFSTLYLCWGAMAGIYYHYGIKKVPLPEKLSGVFNHRVLKATSPLLRGFSDTFTAPHSRYTGIDETACRNHPDLEVLATSDEAGSYLVKSTDSRNFFVFGHPEYDRGTLHDEFIRDTHAGLNPSIPRHYFPHDDPSLAPLNTWRAHGQLLYTNWLNYYVYQATPYDLSAIGRI